MKTSDQLIKDIESIKTFAPLYEKSLKKFVITYKAADFSERHKCILYNSLEELEKDFKDFIEDMWKNKKYYGVFQGIEFYIDYFRDRGLYKAPDIQELYEWFQSKLENQP